MENLKIDHMIQMFAMFILKTLSFFQFFMHIFDAMNRNVRTTGSKLFSLQRSVSIESRHDFSCSLCDDIAVHTDKDKAAP